MIKNDQYKTDRHFNKNAYKYRIEMNKTHKSE